MRQKRKRKLTLPGSQRLREQAILQQVLHIPLGCTLRLPRPEDPAIGLLISVKLCLDKTANVVLVITRQTCDGARRLAITRTDPGCAVQSTVVARALALAVEPLRAIGDTTGPFTRDSPLSSAGHLASEATSCANMILKAHSDLRIVEDLVMVGIEQQVPHAGAEVSPGTDALECIVEGDSDIGVLEVAPAVLHKSQFSSSRCIGVFADHVELLNSVHVERWAHGLIQKLDGGHSWVRSVVVADLVQDLDCVCNSIALSPRYTAQLTRVIEAVLGSRCCIHCQLKKIRGKQCLQLTTV